MFGGQVDFCQNLGAWRVEVSTGWNKFQIRKVLEDEFDVAKKRNG